MEQPILKKYTFLEYLELEEESSEKHEYRNGLLYAMSGGTWNHSIISGNAVTSLNNKLREKGSDCHTTNSDLKVYIEKVNEGVYPDATVVCGEPEFVSKTKSAFTNPMLIIEVLSPSTEVYDRSNKFIKYRKLASFKEYVLISQDQPKVESFYKYDASLWRISTALGLESSIHLYSIDCDIALKDIYASIHFEGGVQGMLDL